MVRVKIRPGMVLNVIGYDAKLLLLSLMMASTVPSCCPCRHLPTHTETSVTDSTAVSNNEHHSVVDSVSVKDSTVAVQLPNESSQAVLPTIMPSHLETSLAVSDAYVDSLGLHHTLMNKDTQIDVHVPVTEHHHYENHSQQDSTAVHHGDSQTQTITEYVEKPLTRWQQFRLGAFWWLVAGLLGAICWIFKKPLGQLVALVKKII